MKMNFGESTFKVNFQRGYQRTIQSLQSWPLIVVFPRSWFDCLLLIRVLAIWFDQLMMSDMFLYLSKFSNLSNALPNCPVFDLILFVYLDVIVIWANQRDMAGCGVIMANFNGSPRNGLTGRLTGRFLGSNKSAPSFTGHIALWLSR